MINLVWYIHFNRHFIFYFLYFLPTFYTYSSNTLNKTI